MGHFPQPRTGRFIDPDGGGECGDGGSTVVFRSDPPGASLWMIVEFDFLLCELEGRKPWSTSECGWYEEQVFGDDQDWGVLSLGVWNIPVHC